MTKSRKFGLGILLCALMALCSVFGLVGINSDNTAYAFGADGNVSVEFNSQNGYIEVEGIPYDESPYVLSFENLISEISLTPASETLTVEGTYERYVIIAVANEGCEFSGWLLNGAELNGSADLGDTITAVFESATHTVTIAAGMGGRVDTETMYKIPHDAVYSFNGNVLVVDGSTIIATPDEYFSFQYWTLNGEQLTSGGTITDDFEFGAVFKNEAKATWTDMPSGILFAGGFEGSVGSPEALERFYDNAAGLKNYLTDYTTIDALMEILDTTDFSVYLSTIQEELFDKFIFTGNVMPLERLGSINVSHTHYIVLALEDATTLQDGGAFSIYILTRPTGAEDSEELVTLEKYFSGKIAFNHPHVYGDVSAVWDGENVTLTVTCTCSHVETTTLKGTYQKLTDATTTEKETGKYVLTVAEGIFAGTYESDPIEVLPEPDKDGLSTGAIVGIIIACVVVVILGLYVLGYFFLYRKGKLEGKKIKVIYKFLPKGKENK